MSDCLFCSIVAGDAPSERLAETEHAVAVRDINPAAPLHVLVLSREHIPSVDDVTPEHAEALASCFGLIQEVARREGVADDGYRVVANVGRHGGMTIPHLHFHLLGGRPLRWPPE